MVSANIKKEAFHTSSFKLDEDYDKAIVPYQTEDFPLNVTAEIYLRFPNPIHVQYIVHCTSFTVVHMENVVFSFSGTSSM